MRVVERLIALGHRDIAFITGSLDSPTGVERLAGYKDALAGHGIPSTRRSSPKGAGRRKPARRRWRACVSAG